MPPWLIRLLAASIRPDDDEVTAARKQLLAGAALFAPMVLVAVGAIYLAYGEQLAGWLYCGYAAWVWLNLFAFARLHRNLELAFWLAAIPALAVHLAVIVDLGDMVHSGGVVLWGLAYPVATGLVFLPVRRMAPLYLMFAANLIVVTLVVPSDRSSLPSAPERAVLVINLFALCVFAVALIALFVAQRDRAYRLLGDEQRRARALLLSILPEEIADELSQQPRVIAEQFDQVSVLFADVVGFTPLSADMAPAELVAMLDDLFAHFDDLVERAGLEKIKTIGDCYMVAAGIPRPCPNHAQQLVRLALQMLQVAQEQMFRGRRLELRIGINSGSVVAGVIGRRKFSYDLWGDVVNTASRMESHGVPGTVQVTHETHRLIQAEFRCTERGVIDVRGKGPLPVWLVTGEQSAN